MEIIAIYAPVARFCVRPRRGAGMHAAAVQAGPSARPASFSSDSIQEIVFLHRKSTRPSFAKHGDRRVPIDGPIKQGRGRGAAVPQMVPWIAHWHARGTLTLTRRCWRPSTRKSPQSAKAALGGCRGWSAAVEIDE